MMSCDGLDDLWRAHGVFRSKLAQSESLGEKNESFSFGQENLPQLQNHPSQGRCPRDLHRSTSQTAPRLIF